MLGIWIEIILGAYLFGSLPTSYLTAKFLLKKDLRQYGTGYLGASNLWRLTSWRIGLPVILFDISKGIPMVLVAQWSGLNIPGQMAVGLAAILGHNWSIFLRFSGGRGNATSLGVIIITPLINGLIPWGAIAVLTIVAMSVITFHDSPLGVIVAIAVLPAVSYVTRDPLAMNLGFLAILLIAIIARLAAPRSSLPGSLTFRQLLFNRLLFDRDVRDKQIWMNRLPGKVDLIKRQ